MRFHYYSKSGEPSPVTYRTRDMRVFLLRSRRPDSTATDGIGPLLHYGKRHSLVFAVNLDGSLECHHVNSRRHEHKVD